MGHRANLIIVEDGDYSLFYCHWCASSLPIDLFWGPDHAQRVIRAQRRVDERGWLNSTWAEGGCLLDLDNRILMLFGGQDINFDVALRRMYIDWVQRVWAGWEIRWAYEGIADLASYVGYPRSNVVSLPADASEWRPEYVEPPNQRDWTDVVGSIRSMEGTLKLFPFFGGVDGLLLLGSRLAIELQRRLGLDVGPLVEWLGEDGYLDGGFHIDQSTKKVEYWNSSYMPGIPQRISEVWLGWIVTWHRDNFEHQLEWCEGRLRFPDRSTEKIRQQLLAKLLHVRASSPVDSMLGFIGQKQQAGKDIQINPYAVRDDCVELDIEERRRILTNVLTPEELA